MKYIYLFFISILLVFSSCKGKEKNDAHIGNTIPVTILPLEKSKEKTTIEATGLFSTDDETLLSFKNGGIIERIYVKEGDFVKKGQLLASLNMTELMAKAEQVKAAIQKAERDYNRAEKLYKDSVATLEQFQNAKTQLDVIEQDWNTLQFNLRYSEIRANSDGYILIKLANEGQIIGPGMPVFQMNGAGAGNWLVKVGVSDYQWANIHLKDSATISTDAFPDILIASVIRKAEGLDYQSGTFTVHVQPTKKPTVPLASGMFAKVKIYGETNETWKIPYSALIDGDRDKGYVFITEDKKTVSKVEVKIASLQAEYALISSGLENHKFLVVSGSPYLRANSMIEVKE
ncbi:MAG: efflux RND transporter periplasmic adaptor subunit [Brumimicrobium sp.]|nr:efflux RND transporter periplasmic adaptor subunit [Brumimicrobium sp.]MCO5269246.1 efflux RND transporter periplasmic adaptor subunit [Brumimicrobium sp.]